MRRAVWIICVLATTVSIAGYVYFGGERKPPIRYRTAPVERGSIESVVTATGMINPVVSVQVGSQVTGKIQSLHADFNSVVKAGELVAVIDPSVYQARRDQAAATLMNAKANVLKAEADLAQRRRELNRVKALLGQQFVSQNDVDIALTSEQGAAAQLEVAKAQIQQAKAQMDATELDLKYTVIRSPVSGIVIARNVEVGQTVTAGFQTPMLFLIALDLTKMQVDTNVSEADIGGMTQGMPVSFTVDAYPGEQFHGTVKQVRNAPISVQNVVTYDVVVAVDNGDLRLKPGMTANVSIVVARRDDVLTVPNAALRFTPPRQDRREAKPAEDRSGSKNTGTSLVMPSKGAAVAQKPVWLETPSGDLTSIPLQIGISDGSLSEVIGGEVQEGDHVIVGIETKKTAEQSNQLPPGFGAGQRRHGRDRGL